MEMKFTTNLTVPFVCYVLSMYCFIDVYMTYSPFLLHTDIIPLSLLQPSVYQPNQLSAYPIINLLFRQLTESRSAPVDEILAQSYQYVSQVHQLHNNYTFFHKIYDLVRYFSALGH